MGKATLMKILLVEDEMFTRLDLADAIVFAGWDLLEAATAREAIRLVRMGASFDVLLTDARMDQSPAGQLTTIVRQHRPQTLIVVMAGLHEPVSDSANLVVRKPVGDVVQVIRNALTRAGHPSFGNSAD